jgi:hypothetical protein
MEKERKKGFSKEGNRDIRERRHGERKKERKKPIEKGIQGKIRIFKNEGKDKHRRKTGWMAKEMN